MSRRSRAREVALQMLYQCDLNPEADGRTVLGMIQERLEEEELSRFAWQLFSGTMEMRSELDRRIEAVAANWRLSRMAPTDRNTLRMGLFELLHMETPHRVVIDEALDLARKFGTEQSSSFVNGILDKLVPSEKRNTGGTTEQAGE